MQEEKKGTHDIPRTDYQQFKEIEEPNYLKTQRNNVQSGTKKRKDWLWWLIALVVLSTSIYFVVDHMFESRDEVYNSAQIARLSAREAVEQMFDGELEYIRRDLTEEEYNQIHEMVDNVPESSEKVQISSLLRKAGEQLESQLEAQHLVDSLKTSSGEPNVDLKRNDLIKDKSAFPRGYDPEYAQELETEYQKLVTVIVLAIDLQDEIRKLARSDERLDKAELDQINIEVEKLPFSDRKTQLTYDMKALYQTYDKQQEELKKQLEEERIEEERLEQERLEQEKLEQERLEQERLEQERIAQEQAEQERVAQEQQQQSAQSEQSSSQQGTSQSTGSNNSNNSQGTTVNEPAPKPVAPTSAQGQLVIRGQSFYPTYSGKDNIQSVIDSGVVSVTQVGSTLMFFGHNPGIFSGIVGMQVGDVVSYSGRNYRVADKVTDTYDRMNNHVTQLGGMSLKNVAMSGAAGDAVYIQTCEGDLMTGYLAYPE